MRRFERGDRVRVAKKHTLRGVTYTMECEVGDFGTVDRVNYDKGREGIGVKWDDSLAPHSTIDADCLQLMNPVTDDELEYVKQSLLGGEQ